jgi:hypothetical protein
MKIHQNHKQLLTVHWRKMVFESSIEFSDAQKAQKDDDSTTEPQTVVASIPVVREDEKQQRPVVVHYHGSRVVPREEDGGPAVDEECAAIFAHVDAMMIPFHDCAFYPGTAVRNDCWRVKMIMFSHSTLSICS